MNRRPLTELRKVQIEIDAIAKRDATLKARRLRLILQCRSELGSEYDDLAEITGIKSVSLRAIVRRGRPSTSPPA